MEETTFAADPMRLMIAAAVGVVIGQCVIAWIAAFLVKIVGFLIGF